jgi:tetratricopeptide (TPR) repeat protein
MGVQTWLRAGVAALLAALAARAGSVAVLPFVNTTSSTVAQASNLDWIGESLAETLREVFASKNMVSLDREDVEQAFAALHLKSRASITQASILKMGEAMDVEQVLYGAFVFTPSAGAGPQDSKGTLKVTARVIDRRRLRQSPELTETGRLEDLARIEAHLAWQALQLAAPELAPPEAEHASLRPAPRLDAEEYYIRGLLANGEEKEKYFRQAATLDPPFSRSCYQLGKIFHARKQYKDAVQWLERVTPGDAHYREANFILGLARYELGDYAGAQKAFQMIAAVVPLSEVYNNLAAAESRRNLPQAADDFRKALEGDPNDPDYHFNLGYTLWKKGDFAGAADRFRAVLVRDPDDEMATILLGRCLKKQGPRSAVGKNDPDARFQALERIKTNYEERAWRLLKSLLESKAE